MAEGEKEAAQDDGAKKKEKSVKIAEQRIFNIGRAGFIVQVRKWPDSEKPYLRLYKWSEGNRQSGVNIGQFGHWLKLKRVVDNELVKSLGWSGYDLPSEAAPQSVTLVEYEAMKSKYERQMKSQAKQLTLMQVDASRMRRKIVREMKEKFKSRLPEYKKTLRELKKKIDARVGETEIHPFLRENFWIFGMEYIEATSKATIGFKNQGDFLLQRDDGYYDVVEIKSPKDEVFTKRGELSKVTKNAVSQMLTYIHKCDIHYFAHVGEMHKNILKPFGLIVVGTSQNRKIAHGLDGEEISFSGNLRIHNAFFNNMRIVTFDELYNDAKITLDRLESRD